MSIEVLTTDRVTRDKMLGKVCEAHHVKLALANSGFSSVLVQTNDNPMMFDFHANAEGLFTVKAHLISSVNVASVNLGVLNHDFRGGYDVPVSSFAVVASYTVSSTFYSEIVGFAGPGPAGGGGTLAEDFWVLAPNTDYVFEAQNISGGAASFSWDMDFTEVR